MFMFMFMVLVLVCRCWCRCRCRCMCMCKLMLMLMFMYRFVWVMRCVFCMCVRVYAIGDVCDYIHSCLFLLLLMYFPNRILKSVMFRCYVFFLYISSLVFEIMWFFMMSLYVVMFNWYVSLSSCVCFCISVILHEHMLFMFFFAYMSPGGNYDDKRDIVLRSSKNTAPWWMVLKRSNCQRK